MGDASPLDFAAFETLRPARCDCGAWSTRVPCWECSRVQERKEEAARRFMARGFPSRFSWAWGEAGPDLLRRYVSTPTRPGTLEEAIERMRGAFSAVFIGPTGSGKTSLAVHLATKREGAMFVRSTELAVAASESPLGRKPEIVERAFAASLLVLDDLGSEPTIATSAVPRVIEKRLDDENPTWITTGIPPGDLNARYGTGIMRRIKEDATVIAWTKKEGEP